MAKQDAQNLLKVTQPEIRCVQIQDLVKQQRHAQLIASERVPETFGIASAPFWHVQIRDEAVAGEHTAGVGMEGMA